MTDQEQSQRPSHGWPILTESAPRALIAFTFMPSPLFKAIRSTLTAVADPEKAPGMQAYMKSTMPYRGVQTPQRRRICRAVFEAHPLASFEEWTAAVLELWRLADYREERYCAIELSGQPRYGDFQTLQTLPMYEEMVTTGAWWDYADEIGGHRLRNLLVRYPKGMSRRMRAWSRDRDLWKRRCSIICQLRRGEDTDVELLFDCIEQNLDDREFFIRKAIGWALRDLAWFDLPTVERYVEKNASRLSGLSRREALKNAAKIRAAG
jgi:3-methyladenine DNA glycosylase AlkD